METFRESLVRLFIPMGRWLAALGIHPHLISLSGPVFGCTSAYFFISRQWALGVVFFILSGFSDVFDGMVARNRGMESSFGSFFDNFCSAYSDSPVLAALIAASLCNPWWGLAALIGTLTRLLGFRMDGLVPPEEAQALRSRFPYALAGKGDRITLIAIGAVLDHINEAVIIIAVLSNLVAVLRCYKFYSWGKALAKP
jgi:CDP-diacylglycerol---glycerol-3-phosphate 3-phosphatidyltransferase